MDATAARIGVLALILFGSAVAQAGFGSGSAFTPDEMRRLHQGELVERPVSVDRGSLRLIGGTSWQVIQASPNTVWQVLLDTQHYDRILPLLAEARLLRDNGTSRSVYLRHGDLAHTSYYLDVQVDRARHALAFRVDGSRPSGIRAAWGFYAVRSYGRGQTLLTYGVMADIGDGLLTALVRPLVHEWMLRVPWLVKRFVEGRELSAMR
jgi:carbon monoxide dehydrogenase subunit G